MTKLLLVGKTQRVYQSGIRNLGRCQDQWHWAYKHAGSKRILRLCLGAAVKKLLVPGVIGHANEQTGNIVVATIVFRCFDQLLTCRSERRGRFDNLAEALRDRRRFDELRPISDHG